MGGVMPKQDEPIISAEFRAILESNLLARAASPGPALRAHSVEESQMIARRLYAKDTSKEGTGSAKEIDAYMRKQGLIPMMSRACAFSPTNRVTGNTKQIAIVPYTSPTPDSDQVGSVGISDGEPASGIIVQLKANQIVNFITVDFLGGKLDEQKIGTAELIASGPQKFVNRKYKRGNLPRDLTQDQSSSVAGAAFQALLFDQHSTMIHTAGDLRRLVHNMPIVTAIAELQYMRLEGVTFSPDVSCCSCCCCCWGSCSSCSAVSSHFVNESYRPRFTN
jgi:hypothetical protein